MTRNTASSIFKLMQTDHGSMDKAVSSLTLQQANKIVDRISQLAQNGRSLRPVIVSEVGASNVAQALAALYLVTAQTFQTSVIDNSSKNHEILSSFIRAADGIGMWIATQFRLDDKSEHVLGVDESVRDSEIIESFVEFLRSLDPRADDYWSRVRLRIST